MGVFLPLLSMSQITPISISESYTLNRNDEWLSLKQVKIAIAGASTPAVIARPTDNIECAIEILSTLTRFHAKCTKYSYAEIHVLSELLSSEH